MLMGFVPRVNTRVNSTHAIAKFAVTPANKIIILFFNVALIRLSLALKSSSCFGSSHFILTNHQRGRRLRVYSVQLLSVQRVITFGGIPIPNSKTFTQLFFAAQKCHNSCPITRSINMMIPKIMPTIFLSIIIKKS
jgi:hypothetical protein